MNNDEILLNEKELDYVCQKCYTDEREVENLPRYCETDKPCPKQLKAAQLKLMEWIHENYFDNATDEYYFMWMSKADLAELENLLKG